MVHKVVDILGIAVILLIAVRYNTEMQGLIGSGSGAINSVFSTAAGFPGGQAIPAAPMRG